MLLKMGLFMASAFIRKGGPAFLSLKHLKVKHIQQLKNIHMHYNGKKRVSVRNRHDIETDVRKFNNY